MHEFMQESLIVTPNFLLLGNWLETNMKPINPESIGESSLSTEISPIAIMSIAFLVVFLLIYLIGFITCLIIPLRSRRAPRPDPDMNAAIHQPCVIVEKFCIHCRQPQTESGASFDECQHEFVAYTQEREGVPLQDPLPIYTTSRV